jgi:hypothetical protein
MFPLQFGVPGGPELLVILLIVLIPIAIGFAMYRYAASRGDDNAALWAVIAAVASLVATPLGGLLVFVVYVWQRD